MVTVIHVTLAEATAALATTQAAAAKAADPIITTDSDTDITDLQTQLTSLPYPKPDVVSSAVFHTDTDDDYDDAGDEGRDKDSNSSSRKPAAVKVKEEDLEVEEGDTYCAVYHSSCTDHMQHPSSVSISNDDNDQGEKKRDLPPTHSNSNKQVKKRQKIVEAFTIDLSDVPPQLPISKPADKVKEGASKYAGVSFDKANKKWRAHISMGGRKRHIGRYVKEKEAAVDYARAVFKYKGPQALALAHARVQNSSTLAIDLSGIPPQSPIPSIKGSSKYKGIYFNKVKNKWIARIKFEGKDHHIGCYENEETAAVDYARAVFKYFGT